MILKDGSETRDPRCGLIFQADPTAPNLLAVPPIDEGIDLRYRELISKYRVKKFKEPLRNGYWVMDLDDFAEVFMKRGGECAFARKAIG